MPNLNFHIIYYFCAIAHFYAGFKSSPLAVSENASFEANGCLYLPRVLLDCGTNPRMQGQTAWPSRWPLCAVP